MSESIAYQPPKDRRSRTRAPANIVLLYPLLITPLYVEYLLIHYSSIGIPGIRPGPFGHALVTFDRVVGLCLIGLIPGALLSVMLNLIHIVGGGVSLRESMMRALLVGGLLIAVYLYVRTDPGGMLGWYLLE